MFEGIVKKGFSILASCEGRPMSRNSVLEELRERKLEAIQAEISEMVFCRSLIVCGKLHGEKERKSWM